MRLQVAATFGLGVVAIAQVIAMNERLGVGGGSDARSWLLVATFGAAVVAGAMVLVLPSRATWRIVVGVCAASLAVSLGHGRFGLVALVAETGTALVAAAALVEPRAIRRR
jgi:hypothetical protein